jgi:hypothetical protein
MDEFYCGFREATIFIYGKPGVPDRISVPIHANKSLKVGLLRYFLKVARLSDDFQPIPEADRDREDG